MMELDFKLAMLAPLDALSKQISTSTLVPTNVNLAIALQYDLCSEGYANGHCVP